MQKVLEEYNNNTSELKAYDELARQAQIVFQQNPIVLEPVQQIDSTSATKGSETDTQEVNETSGGTVIMQGATSSITDNAKKFKDMWSGYEFYTYIFKEICKEFLLIK